MTIQQCDKCRQAIERDNMLAIELGRFWHRLELCVNCAQPIIETLKKYEIFEDSWLKSLLGTKEAV